MRHRLRLTTAERQAILDRLLAVPQLARRRPEYVAADAEILADDIEEVRRARIEARMALGLGQHVEESDEHGVHIGVHELPALPAHVEKAARGRPPRDWDPRLRARLQIAKTVYGIFPPGTATLTRGKREGSEFEALVRFALELAGERVADVHRECIEAARQVNIERA